MTDTTLNVQGMSCDHCRMAVTRAVSAVAGVSAVEVNLEDGTVRVSFDETQARLESLRQAIQGEGYEVVA